jgi:hypothetical protein
MNAFFHNYSPATSVSVIKGIESCPYSQREKAGMNETSPVIARRNGVAINDQKEPHRESESRELARGTMTTRRFLTTHSSGQET